MCFFASAECSVCVQLLPLKRMTAEASASEWNHAQNWAQASMLCAVEANTWHWA